jgi:hypothetical protein
MADDQAASPSDPRLMGKKLPADLPWLLLSVPKHHGGMGRGCWYHTCRGCLSWQSGLGGSTVFVTQNKQAVLCPRKNPHSVGQFAASTTLRCQTFHYWDQYLRKPLKARKICFGSWFQKFQSIMAGRVWWSRGTHPMAARKQTEDACTSGISPFLSHFYSIRAHSLWDGAAHVQAKSSRL